MAKDLKSHIHTCIALMLEPVIRFCISRGIHIQDFTEIAKGCFVKEAENKLRKQRGEISTSKISIMSGIQRPEVMRLRNDESPTRSKDFISKIVGQWVSDKRFIDSKKKPKKLSISGKKSEFAKLASAVSKDLNPHTVRFEMERLGLLENKNGFAHLTQPAYITSGDPVQTLKFISEDTNDLLYALEENASSAHYLPNLHARTQYDNIADENIPQIREWLLNLGKRVHQECREFLSKFDRDISKEHKGGTGRNRVLLNTFSRVEILEENPEEEQ